MFGNTSQNLSFERKNVDLRSERAIKVEETWIQTDQVSGKFVKSKVYITESLLL